MKLKIFAFIVFLSCTVASQATIMDLYSLQNLSSNSSVKCIICKSVVKSVIDVIKNHHSSLADKVAASECPKIASTIQEEDCKSLIDTTIQLVTNNVTISPENICMAMNFC